MSPAESGTELVMELAEEFLARYRQGERPPLREYIDRHPELEAEIRDVFPAMAMMEKIAVADDSIEGTVKLSGLPSAALKQLGDYRIIREIGRGGMGVVYEAEQVSLGRHVALKLLPNQALHDVKQKRRFEREARAAAKLHHTNIVPVFGVGDHDGVPYYVMQFIQGLGLDAVLDELNHLQPGVAATKTGMPAMGELRAARRDVSAVDMARSLLTGTFQKSTDGDLTAAPKPSRSYDETLDQPVEATPPVIDAQPESGRHSDSFAVSSSSFSLTGASGTGKSNAGRKQTYWQSVANIGRQVAEALEYAHKQGIQHRDVKPSNLLLDMKGTVWVTDFGLAKVAGPDAENLTHTGDILGTLRYMPPEAFEGKSDARSDVYSLGLTLYELLAMRPAFDETERHKLIKQVTTGEPTSLSKVRREVPRDLVTIVQKSIAREPSRRYATAEDLATDLQRFLDDEPIQARRQTQLERCVRWARHHPSIAALAGVLATVLVLATIASLLAARHFNQLRWNEVQAAQAERDARQEADDARAAETVQRQNAETSQAAALVALKEADAQRKVARHQTDVTQQNLYFAQMHLAQQSWRDHRGIQHMRELLTNWLPQGDAPDRRGWEWFFINSLPYQNVRTFSESGADGRPVAVAWNITSGRLAEGASDGTVRIWDVEREVVTLTLKGPAPNSPFWGTRWLAWNSDGTRLAAGAGDASVRAWEIPSGREVAIFRGHTTAIATLAFSSDDQRLAAWGSDGKIKIWNASTEELLENITHPGGVTAGAWSPDGKLLATGHQKGKVTISGARAGDKPSTVQAHFDTVYYLTWSPDSSRLVSTGEFTAKIWDAATKKMVVGPMRHSHGVATAAWQPDGKRLATGSFDQAIKVWDTTTGQEAVTLRGHPNTVSSLAWGPGGRLASGCTAGSLKVWDSVHDQESSALPGHGVRATAVAWNPDGKRLASAGDDGTIRIWDPATRKQLLSIAAHDKRKIDAQFGLIRTLSWSPDGKLIASGGLDGKAKVWDAASGREVFALPDDGGRVWTVAWNPDGSRLAIGSENGAIRIVDGIPDAPKVHSFKAHQPRTRGLAWSRQGDRLASVGIDGLVKIWDPVKGTELHRMSDHFGGVFRVAWSADDKRIVTAGNDRFIFAWDTATGKKIATMRGHNDWIDAVVWSPDGTRLATASIDSSVRIWDPNSGEESFKLPGNTSMFHDIAWHPDGSKIAAASSNGHIWLWDATPGYEHDTTAQALPYIERKLATKPASTAEHVRFAKLAFDNRKYSMAARLWADAFQSDAKLGDDRQSQHRYHAVRAACLAAAGAGRDEPPLDAVAKAKLRRQARDWLAADLAAWGKVLDADPNQDREGIVWKLIGWKYDADLAGIRDAAALTQLPDDEQKDLTQLWTQVAATLKTANARHAVFLQNKLAAMREAKSEANLELAYLLAQIGRAHLEQEQWAEAEPVLRECLALREKLSPEAWTTFNTYTSLGGALFGQKKYDEAKPLLLKGYEGMKKRESTIPAIGKARLPEAIERLIAFYTATNQPAEVKKWQAELAKMATGSVAAEK